MFAADTDEHVDAVGFVDVDVGDVDVGVDALAVDDDS